MTKGRVDFSRQILNLSTQSRGSISCRDGRERPYPLTGLHTAPLVESAAIKSSYRVTGVFSFVAILSSPTANHSPMRWAKVIPALIPNHPHTSTIAKVRKAVPRSNNVTVPLGAINTRSSTFHRPLPETISPPAVKPPSSPMAQTIPCITVEKIWFIASR